MTSLYIYAYCFRLIILPDDSGKDGIVRVYYCQFAWVCRCLVRLKLVMTKAEILAYRQAAHDLNSHVIHYGKRMSLAQIKYVVATTKANPNTLPSTVRRGSYNLEEESQRIGPHHS